MNERPPRWQSTPILREGLIYAGACALAGIVSGDVLGPLVALVFGRAGRVSGRLCSLPFFGAGMAMLCFFRNPPRHAPADPDLVVSAADGRVTAIESLPEDGEFATRISVFLSIFDVHVNRCPVAGRVAAVRYARGEFVHAGSRDAHLRNEQNRVRLEGTYGAVELVQIAGETARRIVCWLKPGDQVSRGQRMGLIKFGSRTDVYLPAGAVLLVHQGDRVRGGASALARLRR